MTVGSITAAGHTLAKAGGGSITCDFMIISRSTATPANTWNATNSTDNGNNSGWNFIVAPVVVIPQAPTLSGGGSHPSQGRSLYELQKREERGKREIAADRERFGIPDDERLKAERIIQEVAKRQAEALERDAQKRFEELARELELEKILLDASHLEALNTRREALIDAELKAHFARLQEEEEMLLLIAASIA